MDPDWEKSQLALRARAEEAISAALAAADARAPIPGIVVESTMAAVKLACWDQSLEPRDRLLLIDDALALLWALKELPRASEAARPELTVHLLRRCTDLLRRYAEFVRVRK
jgi:hypothetical protein